MGLFDRLKQLFSSKALPRIDVEKRFETHGKLGQGSMSKVFQAIDRKSGRKYCLKILDREKTAKFEERFAGLNRPSEGAICSSLHHENVVETFEFGLTQNGEQFLLMELIDGAGLNFLIDTKSKQLDGRRLDFLVQMAAGLDYIHAQGYLHRDICPRNLLVTRGNVVKYIDFGLAIPYRPEFCRPGNRTGTADYLAPEVIKRLSTDHRVDLFALGVTAYETLTGCKPWESTRSVQAMTEHLRHPGRDPRELRPDLDEAASRFLLKAIEREARARFQTAVEFREAAEKLPKKY